MLLSKMLWMTAWRNLWRNKRRTLIILTAIIVGLLGVISYIGLVNAWWGQSVENAVAILTGHVQIQAPGYHENPQLKRNLVIDPALRGKLMAIENVVGVVPRIKTPILVSNAEKSEMANVVATVADDEPQVSMIPRSVVEGRWLETGDQNRVVIGATMARRFKTKLGRRLIIRATDPHGEMVDAVFRVVGIYNTGLQAFDRSTVYIRLADAQRLFDMPDRATEWVIATRLPEHADLVKALAADYVDPNKAVVTTWKDLNPMIVQLIEMSASLMWVFNLFFYMAMAFGIANTMLMSVLERTREIGMMLALGVKRSLILAVIMVEALLLALFASAIGAGLGGAIIAHYDRVGIDLTRWIDAMEFLGMRGVMNPYIRTSDMIIAVAATLVVALLMAIYPAWKASRLNPTDALRHT